jgi:hypothetical protein
VLVLRNKKVAWWARQRERVGVYEHNGVHEHSKYNVATPWTAQSWTAHTMNQAVPVVIIVDGIIARMVNVFHVHISHVDAALVVVMGSVSTSALVAMRATLPETIMPETTLPETTMPEATLPETIMPTMWLMAFVWVLLVGMGQCAFAGTTLMMLTTLMTPISEMSVASSMSVGVFAAPKPLPRACFHARNQQAAGYPLRWLGVFSSQHNHQYCTHNCLNHPMVNHCGGACG